MPTITLDYLNTFIQDTQAASVQPTVNYGKQTSWAIVKDTQESFLRFNLGLIPNHAIISSAELRLVQAANLSGSVDVTLQPVAAEWLDTTLTWNNRPEALSSPSVTINILNGANGSIRIIDIRTLVQEWVTGKQNNGLRLTSNSAVALSFHSAEITTAAYRPSLTITYTLPDTDEKPAVLTDSIFNTGAMTSTTGNVAVLSVNIPVPPSREVGDMLIVSVTYVTPTGEPAPNIRIPEGWSKLFDEDLNTTHKLAMLYKVSEGDEYSVSIQRFNNGNFTFAATSFVFENVSSIKKIQSFDSTATLVISTANFEVPDNSLILLNTATNTISIGTPGLSNTRYADSHNATNLSNYMAGMYRASEGFLTMGELPSVTMNRTNVSHSVLLALEGISNLPPSIDGADMYLGFYSEPLIKDYTVTDYEGEDITITEKLNGTILRTFQGSGLQSLDLSTLWDSLDIGKHTVTIEANDTFDPSRKPVRTWTLLKVLNDNDDIETIIAGLEAVDPFLDGIKTSLISKVESTSGLTDTFEEIIEAIPYRPKKASGTITSSATNFGFVNQSGAGASYPRVDFDMTTLDFIPSRITLIRGDRASTAQTIWYKDNYYVSGAQFANIAYSNVALRSPYIPGVVPIPVSNANMEYIWEANE